MKESITLGVGAATGGGAGCGSSVRPRAGAAEPGGRRIGVRARHAAGGASCGNGAGYRVWRRAARRARHYVPILAFACALALAGAAAAAADEIHLKNGDYITGHIISMDEESVIVSTSYGELTIDRSQILAGSFSSEESVPEEALEVELLFDGDPEIPEGSTLTVAEYGVQRSTGADGTPDSSVRSTGNGAYIELTGTPRLDSARDLTISFWVFPREATRLQYILSKWETTEDGRIDGKFAVGTRYSALYVYLMDPSGDYHLQSFEEIVPPDAWTHIAVVFDSGMVRVYQDGSFAGQSELSFSTLNESSSPLYILTAKASTDDTWAYYNLDGMLDNLRIYSRALIDMEIAELAGEL